MRKCSLASQDPENEHKALYFSTCCYLESTYASDVLVQNTFVLERFTGTFLMKWESWRLFGFTG